jgi:hypothetical protein
VRAPEGNGCAERFIRTQREPALGPELRHPGGLAPRAPSLPRDLQHRLAH